MPILFKEKIVMNAQVDGSIDAYNMRKTISILKKITPYLNDKVDKSEELSRIINEELSTWIDSMVNNKLFLDNLNKFIYERMLIQIISLYNELYKHKFKNLFTLDGDFMTYVKSRGRIECTIKDTYRKRVIDNVFQNILDSYNDYKLEIVINSLINTNNRSHNEVAKRLKGLLYERINMLMNMVVLRYSKTLFTRTSESDTFYTYCIEKLQLCYNIEIDAPKPPKEGKKDGK